jgi:hypothetical protein
VASKIMSLLRKRGVLMLVLSVASALLAAKGGGSGYGFFDGPI